MTDKKDDFYLSSGDPIYSEHLNNSLLIGNTLKYSLVLNLPEDFPENMFPKEEGMSFKAKSSVCKLIRENGTIIENNKIKNSNRFGSSNFILRIYPNFSRFKKIKKIEWTGDLKAKCELYDHETGAFIANVENGVDIEKGQSLTVFDIRFTIPGNEISNIRIYYTIKDGDDSLKISHENIEGLKEIIKDIKPSSTEEAEALKKINQKIIEIETNIENLKKDLLSFNTTGINEKISGIEKQIQDLEKNPSSFGSTNINEKIRGIEKQIRNLEIIPLSVKNNTSSDEGFSKKLLDDINERLNELSNGLYNIKLSVSEIKFMNNDSLILPTDLPNSLFPKVNDNNINVQDQTIDIFYGNYCESNGNHIYSNAWVGSSTELTLKVKKEKKIGINRVLWRNTGGNIKCVIISDNKDIPIENDIEFDVLKVDVKDNNILTLKFTLDRGVRLDFIKIYYNSFKKRHDKLSMNDISGLSDLNNEFQNHKSTQTSIYSIQKNINEKLDKKNASFETIINTLKNSITRFESSISGLETSISALKTSSSGFKTSISALENSSNTFKTSISALENSSNTFKNSISALETSSNNFKNSISGFKNSISALENRCTNLEEKNLEYKKNMQNIIEITGLLKIDTVKEVEVKNPYDISLKNIISNIIASNNGILTAIRKRDHRFTALVDYLNLSIVKNDSDDKFNVKKKNNK